MRGKLILRPPGFTSDVFITKDTSGSQRGDWAFDTQEGDAVVFYPCSRYTLEEAIGEFEEESE